jgi:Flp pilus assembly pilin Flp
MFTHFKRRVLLRDESGSMIVEFGLMVPLLVILISGLVEFGMAYTLRMNLSHAAREGVRVYSLVDGGDWAGTTLNAAGTAPAGVPAVTAASSGNCPLPSVPPSPAVQSWVQATRANYQIRIAFLPAISVNLTGRAVMRCGG